MKDPQAKEAELLADKEVHRLRITIGESQRHDHLPVYEWLTRHALDRGLAGATVFRAELGYGASSHAKMTGLGSLSADASMVVDLVDSKARLLDFLKEIDGVQAVRKGIVTLEPIEVLFYRSG